MGKGIVASDLDQIGEVLRHDVTALLVKPADVKSLCEGMIVLIEDKSRRERLEQMPERMSFPVSPGRHTPDGSSTGWRNYAGQAVN